MFELTINPSKLTTMKWKKKIEEMIYDFIGNLKSNKSVSQLATEIADQSYPKSFVMWVLFKQDDFIRTCDYNFKSRSTNPIEDNGIYYTLDDLFRYWCDEIDK